MKAKALLTAILAIFLAGCTPPKKTAKTPVAPKPVVVPVAAPAPPPPPPLSLPQTRVELPKPQPLDPAALETQPDQQEPPPTATTARPRRPAVPATPPADPPAAAPTTPGPRETVREIIAPTELKRLQEQAQSRRREANQILMQLARRQLSSAQRNVVETIRSFLALSDEAERQNDPRQADSLAERAQILAKELLSGK